jgi:hypothetical protein
VPVWTLQTSPPSQHDEQPHSVEPGEHSGTQLPLVQIWPQLHGGSQTSGTQLPFSQVWPGSMHGPSQIPPQPSLSPQCAPEQSGAQQLPPEQISPALQHCPEHATRLLAQQKSSAGAVLVSS